MFRLLRAVYCLLTKMKRSGVILAFSGAAGVLFFWVTDPRFGLVRRLGSDENVVDAVNQALIPTAVGIAGSFIVLCIGLWLTLRRST